MTEREPDREPEQAAFEGRVVRPARRRIDPLRIGVAIAVVGLAAAVIKPWDGPTQTTEAQPGPAALASPAADPATEPSHAPAPVPITDLPSTPAIDWAKAAVVIRPHDGWGVRAIVRETGVPVIDPQDGLGERWVATDPPDLASPPSAVPAEDRAPLAIGLTFPSESTPIDVRIRRQNQDHTWEWIDAQPLDANPAGGAYLFAPPTADGRAITAWPSGDYRFDVLEGGRIASIEVRIAGRFGRVPLSAIAPPNDALASPLPVDLSSVDAGVFAVVDGAAIPVAAQDTASVLDPAAAWLDVLGRSGSTGIAGPDGAGPAGDVVGDAYLPGANGLGVLSPSGADDLHATLRRIDVDGQAALPILPAGTFTSIGTGVTPYAVFAAPDGRAFAPGLYAIESSWRDGAGNESRVEHIELRPGPSPSVSRLLDAVRYVADDRGTRPATFLFTFDRVGWLPLIVTSGGELFDQSGCEPPAPGLDTSSTNLLAFAGLPADDVDQIRVRAIFAGGRQADVPVLISSDVAPGIDAGITLVAPASGDVFGSGVYRVTIGRGADARTGTLCLGPLVYQ